MCFKMCLEVWGISYFIIFFFHLYFFNSCWNAALFIFKQNLQEEWIKSKSITILQGRLAADRYVWLKEPFHKDRGRQSLGNRAAPFPISTHSLSHVISPAPDLSPLLEVRIKCRVTAAVAVSAAPEVVLVWQGSLAGPLAAHSPLLSKSSSAVLHFGEDSPSVFQWNIWCYLSFHTIMLLNSSAVFSSLFSLRNVDKFWGLFPLLTPWVKWPVLLRWPEKWLWLQVHGVW